MKKLKELKSLHGIFVDSINELDTKLQNQLKKIKLEYQQNMIEEKRKLLLAICNGEGLDYEKTKMKYLKGKELTSIQEPPEKELPDEPLLDKIEINGNEYYYESKEKGLVYNNELKQVGLFKSGKIVFT
jgi:hypothetical protein